MRNQTTDDPSHPCLLCIGWDYPCGDEPVPVGLDGTPYTGPLYASLHAECARAVAAMDDERWMSDGPPK